MQIYGNCKVQLSVHIPVHGSNRMFQDLEGYGNSYTGLARLYRLIYIADHCPGLRLEALKMAITYVMCTYNVALYQQLHKKLQEAVG